MKNFLLQFLTIFICLSFTACSKDDEGSESASGNTHANEQSRIEVVIYENGITSNGSKFSAIDEDNFYLDYIKYTIEDDYLVLSDCDATRVKGDIRIPSKITYKGNSYDVRKIGPSALCYCSKMSFLTIPNSVKSIGHGAFRGCYSLQSLTLGNGLDSVDELAFSECYGLSSVTINTKKIQGWFSYLDGLEEVVIGDDVESIEDGAFHDCSGLTSVTIPNSVKSIGMRAFEDCSSLTSVTISNNVNSIEGETFKGCSRLTSVTIPNSVKSIGTRAFSDCRSLTSVTLGRSVSSIAENAFEGCNMITAIDIDEENYTYDSRNHCNAIIETSTNTLIKGCTRTTIPDGVTTIGERAFSGCTLISVAIPNSVTSIKNEAFMGCYGLTYLTIPKNVTNIGFRAFYGSNLVNLTVEASTPPKIDWNVFDGLSLKVIFVPKESVEEYKIASTWFRYKDIIKAFGE